MMTRLIGLLFAVHFYIGPVYSQISISKDELETSNAVGTTSTSNFDSTLTAADIGSTGSSSWDFSSLVPTFSYTTACVDPSASPYGGSFPSSTICRKYTFSMMGFESNNWLFNSVDDGGFYLDGIVTATQAVAGFSVSSTTTYSPSENQLKLPLTYGTSWTQDYSYTTVSSTGGPAITTNLHTVNTVDAFGSLVLPGGTTVEALRMKRDEQSVTSSIAGSKYSRTIGYIFYTESGFSISVSSADTLQPDHGVINVSGAGWITGDVTASREENLSIPADFYLGQNYPNPFNPTTTITYRLPENSLTLLRVFDALGREVAMLVDRQQGAGAYAATFDGTKFPSGVYFCRLDAQGSDGRRFSSTKKLMLVK